MYEPEIRPLIEAVVRTGIVFHEYIYGPVPPAGVAVALPSEPAKHDTSTEAIVVLSAAAGSVMFTVSVSVQPLLSVRVTVYEPAMRPVAVAVVCTGTVLHEYEYGVVPPPGIAVAFR